MHGIVKLQLSFTVGVATRRGKGGLQPLCKRSRYSFFWNSVPAELPTPLPSYDGGKYTNQETSKSYERKISDKYVKGEQTTLISIVGHSKVTKRMNIYGV